MYKLIHFKTFLLSTLLIVTSSLLFGQIEAEIWKENQLTVKDLNKTGAPNEVDPKQYYQIDVNQFQSLLRTEKQSIFIPNPLGTIEEYVIFPSTVVAPEVAHLYTIKTFSGYKKDEPSVLISCDISIGGFHTVVYAPGKTFIIEPSQIDQPKEVVVSYKRSIHHEGLRCTTLPRRKQHLPETSHHRAPTAKRTFRLAVTAAGEYSQQFGGSPYNATNVLNAIASGVNMINPIFLRDLGIDFTLVSGTNLVFPNPVTDPFNGLDIDENVVQTNNILGLPNYDLGHLVMWANTGGVAGLDVTCTQDKALGGSGENTSVTTLWIDYVCHEIGHQLGSEHNFAAASCGQSAAGHRFEPGEGSSIMSYANVCDSPDRYVSASDPYFHYNSIDQMLTALNGTSCGVTGGNNSSDPSANALSDITIPKETPFILVGAATDGNDPTGQLTYGWQQYDGNGGETQGAPNCSSNNQPLFRYRPPTNNTFRYFPQYQDVLNGNNNSIPWEKLPCTARTINFSLLVRDNNTSFGRTSEDQMKVSVANTGPFEVSGPNGGEVVTGGQLLAVNWTVNGTDSHCSNVDILLSIDGGLSYSVLVNGTSNDGNQSVTLPNTPTTSARIIVRCDVAGGYRSASTFYDVSNGNFTINSGTPPSAQDLFADDSCMELSSKPTEGHFIIEGVLNNYDIQVLDINGQLVEDFTGQGNNIDIDYTTLPLNYFFLKVENRNNPALCFQTIIKE